MNRGGKLEAFTRAYFNKIMWEKGHRVCRYLKENKESVVAALLGIIRNNLAVCEDRGKIIKFIRISILRSSIVTGSYEMDVSFRDKRDYLDQAPICAVWKPEYIFSTIGVEVNGFAKAASDVIIRLREDEIDEARRRFVYRCHFYSLYVLLKVMPAVMSELWEESTVLDVLDKEGAITFGDYMEPAIQTWAWGK